MQASYEGRSQKCKLAKNEVKAATGKTHGHELVFVKHLVLEKGQSRGQHRAMCLRCRRSMRQEARLLETCESWQDRAERSKDGLVPKLKEWKRWAELKPGSKAFLEQTLHMPEKERKDRGRLINAAVADE